MSPEHVKEIQMFKKIVQYNSGYLKHNQAKIASESGLSVPTISMILKTEFNAESALWLSTIAKIQDYIKKYVETKNYMLSLASPEVQFRQRDKPMKKIKPPIEPEQFAKKHSKFEKKHQEPKESSYDMDNFVPDSSIPKGKFSEEIIAKIRQHFPDAEITINITIKPPQI